MHNQTGKPSGFQSYFTLWDQSQALLQREIIDGGSLLVVTLDLSKFEKPAELEIKRAKIVELVKKAVEANFPTAQIIATTVEKGAAQKS